MNPSQRNAALVFLAAIALVAISHFVSGAVMLVLAILLAIGTAITASYRARQLARSNPTPKLFLKLLSICVFAAVAYFAIMELIDARCRRLAVFNQAVNTLQKSPQASQLLGAPIRISWPVRAPGGTLSNDSGDAHLLIPVTGTIHSARLLANGISAGDSSKLTDLQLVLPNGTTVTLAPTH